MKGKALRKHSLHEKTAKFIILNDFTLDGAFASRALVLSLGRVDCTLPYTLVFSLCDSGRYQPLALESVRDILCSNRDYIMVL